MACGKCARSLSRYGLWHSAARVGEIAHRARGSGGPFLLGDLNPKRRYAGHPCDPVLCAKPHDVAGQKIVHQHDMRADAERRRELAEPGVETQGENGQDYVVGGVLQILADALGADDQVSMAQYHALRLAGAA